MIVSRGVLRKIQDLEDSSKHFAKTPTTTGHNGSKWYAARLEAHTKLGYGEQVKGSLFYLIPSLYCTKLQIGFEAVLLLGSKSTRSGALSAQLQGIERIIVHEAGRCVQQLVL